MTKLSILHLISIRAIAAFGKVERSRVGTREVRSAIMDFEVDPIGWTEQQVLESYPTLNAIADESRLG